MILVAELMVTVLETVPLNFTYVTPVKFVPEIDTMAPTLPDAGLNAVMPGADGVTVKLPALRPVPAGVVTEILPVVAPLGTTAVIDVADFTLIVGEAVPLNLTAVAPVKLVPVMVISFPTGPLVGVNDVTVGADAVTVKFVALVATPAGVVIVILPVVAPTGVVAVIDVADFTVTDLDAVPLNLT